MYEQIIIKLIRKSFASAHENCISLCQDKNIDFKDQ